MYYINDVIFSTLLKSATRVATRYPWDIQKRLNAYSVIRRWDSGERIAPSSGEWEEQARLVDAAGELFLVVQEVYRGERHGDKAPEFFAVPRNVIAEVLS